MIGMGEGELEWRTENRITQDVSGRQSRGILDSPSSNLQEEPSGKPVYKKVTDRMIVHPLWNTTGHEEIKDWV